MEEAYDLLEQASAVIVDDNAVTYPTLDVFTGEPDNEWLFIKWENDEGQEFSVKFNERAAPKISGGKLVMVDHEGEETTITLLQVWRLE